MKMKYNLHNVRVYYVLFYFLHRLRTLYAVLPLSNRKIFSITAKLGDMFWHTEHIDQLQKQPRQGRKGHWHTVGNDTHVNFEAPRHYNLAEASRSSCLLSAGLFKELRPFYVFATHVIKKKWNKVGKQKGVMSYKQIVL
jgi:hypothetical protein